MTAQGYKTAVFGVGAALILAANVVGYYFPGIPSFAYAAAGLAIGAAFIPLHLKLSRRYRLVLSDERTHANRAYAASAAYRIGLAAIVVFVTAANDLPGLSRDWLVAGRALIVFMLFQTAVFWLFYAIRTRRS